MKVLSVFDGISCGRVALERLSIPVEKYVAYEIDESAIQVSKDNYSDIEHRGDVFVAEYQEGEYDLLIGGSPCTYWSIGKNGDNRETTSSGLGWDLFSQYSRALKEAKPKYFLYENVYSMSDEIKGEITKHLEVEPVMIDSNLFSAQNRKRLYWTNIPLSIIPTDLDPANIIDIMQCSSIPRKTQDITKYAHTIKKGEYGIRWDTSGKGYYSQSSRARYRDQKMTTLTTSMSHNKIYIDDNTVTNITILEAERLQTLPDDYTKALKSQGKRFKGIGNGWTVEVIKFLLQNLPRE